MPLLLAACPSFRDRPADNDDGEDRLHYSDAGHFVHHLLRLHRAGATAEVAAAMQVIERLHVEGDAYVRILATVGYLEDLQNIAGHADDLDPADFVPYLGPESRRWWNGLNAFWDGSIPPPVRPADEP